MRKIVFFIQKIVFVRQKTRRKYYLPVFLRSQDNLAIKSFVPIPQ